MYKYISENPPIFEYTDTFKLLEIFSDYIYICGQDIKLWLGYHMTLIWGMFSWETEGIHIFQYVP